MIKLSFSQNDPLMGESFWQNKSLVTHILFEPQPIIIFSPVANFGDQSLGLDLKKYKYLFQNVPSNIDPAFLSEVEGNLQKSLKAHDTYLETRGPVSKSHRCNPVPFSKELRKKKKYKSIAKVNKSNKFDSQKLREFYPLFNKTLANADLKDNALFICKEGEKWREPEIGVLHLFK